MKSFINAVRAAEAATGAGSRAVKEDAVRTLSDIGKKLVCEALSPYIVYGVKKFNMPKAYAAEDAPVEDFFRLLSALSNRTVTGNSAKQAIEEVLGMFTKDTAEILARVIRKDLKWGLSGETVNEVLLGEKRPAVPVVPVYACALAEKFDKKKFKWKFPALLEAKYDGQRNQAFYETAGEASKLFHKARSGKDSAHLDGLFDADFAALNRALSELTLGDGCKDAFVLDGEVMGATWNDTMSAKGSDNQDKKDLLNLYAYDIVPRGEWNVERCTMTQLDRTMLLDRAVELARAEYGMTRIFKSKWRMVYSVEEAEAFYSECLDEGFEGAMIKDPDALYQWKRSSAWTKWKPVDTFDGVIVDFYAGKEGKGLEHTLGGVTIEGVDENGVKFRCDVGSGFPRDLRDEMFNNKEKYRGMMTEIEASPDLNIKDGREYQTLKWGVYKKFRTDKT
jgi:DNA ligase 1